MGFRRGISNCPDELLVSVHLQSRRWHWRLITTQFTLQRAMPLPLFSAASCPLCFRLNPPIPGGRRGQVGIRAMALSRHHLRYLERRPCHVAFQLYQAQAALCRRQAGPHCPWARPRALSSCPMTALPGSLGSAP